ncbi:MAG: Ig-like domain-containing protein [Clostridia bacterium]|nr:Ig-like domain-containing protein [Clostridia bacterium]
MLIKTKRLLAALLTLTLLAGCAPALAEEAAPAVVEIVELPAEEAAVGPETEEAPVPAAEITEETPAAEASAEPTAEFSPAPETSVEPTAEPAVVPLEAPSAEPTVEITAEPSSEAASMPSEEPIPEASAEPAAETTVEPAAEATVEPVAESTAEPDIAPSVDPSVEPSVEPTIEPSVEPSVEPSIEPTVEPTPEPALPQILLNAEALKLGVSEKFTITPALSTGEDAEFSFASENAKIATVDKKGLVTAKKAGETTIIVSCGELIAEIPVTVVKAPTKVTLSATKLSMGAGQMETLTAELNNGNESAVTFTSSKKSVATVDENGVITAIGKGKATITAKAYNGKSAKCTVTVLAAPTELKLNTYELTLPAGMEAKLSASVEKNAYASYSFASSNENVASVDGSGNIVAVNPGATVITVTTYNGLTAACSVTVTEAPTAVTLNANTMTLGVGEPFQLIPANDKGVPANYAYASSDAKIATVDKNGLVTAKKAGVSTITVSTYNGLTAVCEITIVKAPTKVTLSAAKLSMGVGQTEKLTVRLNNGDIGSYSFSTSKASVATVDENGVITAVGKGTAKITATTYNKKKATCTVTVLAAPESLSLAETAASIPMGMKLDLKPSVEKGAMANYVCTSSDETVATVDNSGKVTAVNPGSATITITAYNGLTAACEVTVTPAPTAITLSTGAVELGVKESFLLTAEADVESALSYKSGNAKIATVGADGMITAKKVGSTVITVSTFNGVTAECVVTVMKAPTKISLNEDSVELATGETFQLEAELPSGCAGAVTFASSDASIATVDASGLVTAVSAGEAVITATTYNGKKAVCKVTVTGPYVTPATDFTYTTDENGCTITSYFGPDLHVVIPETIDGVSVVSISAEFGCNPDVRSITLPASLTDIGSCAFEYCFNLEEFRVADGNSSYKAQDGVLFENGGNTLLAYPASKASVRYSIPENCTRLADCAFSGGQLLKWVVVPATVTDFGDTVFIGCSQVSLIIEKGSAAESFAQVQGVNYSTFRTDLTEAEKEIEFRNADLFRAEQLGLNVECADESTVTGAEYMQMLDWFISQAAPERTEEWQAMFARIRESEKPFGRDDAMAALYAAAELAGESYLKDMYDGMYIHDVIGDDWYDYSPDYYLFEEVLDKTPVRGGELGFSYLVSAYFFSLSQGSRYTSARLFDYDPVSNSMRPEALITPEEALASVVRLLDAEEALPVHNETSAAEKEIEDSIDAQREAILNSESEYEVKGKVYYVSPNGDDNNDGLSPETAFRTLDKINSAALEVYGEIVVGNPEFPEFMNVSKNPEERLVLNPGDVVLFERGMEWRGMLRAAEGVTYSAYGEGAKPVINSSPENGAGEGKWELVEGTDNIWKYHMPMQDCGGILLDEEQVATKTLAWWNNGKYFYVGDQHHFENVDGEFEIYEEFNWGVLENLRFFNYIDYGDSQTLSYAKYGDLYLRCDEGNPGLIYDDIEFFTGLNGWAQSVFGSNCDNIILDNLSFKHSATGIAVGTDERGTEDNESVIVRNCEVSWSGGIRQTLGELVGNQYNVITCGDGIAVFSSNAQIYNNYVHHLFDNGITIESFAAEIADGEPLPAYLRRKNNSIYGNLVEKCGGGIMVGDWTTYLKNKERPTYENIYVYDNLVANIGDGWSHMEDWDVGVNTALASLLLEVNPGYKNINFTNNLLYKTRDISQLVSISAQGDYSAVLNFSGNTYVQNENGGIGVLKLVMDKGYDSYRFTYSDYADLAIKYLLNDADANVLPTDLLALGLGPIAIDF